MAEKKKAHEKKIDHTKSSNTIAHESTNEQSESNEHTEPTEVEVAPAQPVDSAPESVSHQHAPESESIATTNGDSKPKSWADIASAKSRQRQLQQQNKKQQQQQKSKPLDNFDALKEEVDQLSSEQTENGNHAISQEPEQQQQPYAQQSTFEEPAQQEEEVVAETTEQQQSQQPQQEEPAQPEVSQVQETAPVSLPEETNAANGVSNIQFGSEDKAAQQTLASQNYYQQQPNQQYAPQQVPQSAAAAAAAQAQAQQYYMYQNQFGYSYPGMFDNQSYLGYGQQFGAPQVPQGQVQPGQQAQPGQQPAAGSPNAQQGQTASAYGAPSGTCLLYTSRCV